MMTLIAVSGSLARQFMQIKRKAKSNKKRQHRFSLNKFPREHWNLRCWMSMDSSRGKLNLKGRTASSAHQKHQYYSAMMLTKHNWVANQTASTRWGRHSARLHMYPGSCKYASGEVPMHQINLPYLVVIVVTTYTNMCLTSPKIPFKCILSLSLLNEFHHKTALKDDHILSRTINGVIIFIKSWKPVNHRIV